MHRGRGALEAGLAQHHSKQACGVCLYTHPLAVLRCVSRSSWMFATEQSTRMRRKKEKKIFTVTCL